jgi:hypothetical protein
MNYAELVDAIQGYTENTFTDSQLATFVQQTEQRVFNTVQFPSLRKNMTGATTLTTSTCLRLLISLRLIHWQLLMVRETTSTC